MAAALDLTGQQFGRLVALKRAENRKGIVYWGCRCSCGNTVEVARTSLTSGATQSCGCLAREQKRKLGRPSAKNIEGQRFGRLLVLERDLAVRKGTEAVWKCLCDCGNCASVRGSSLRRGTSTSCGCFAREEAARRCHENALPEGEAALNDLFGRYKRQARQRGYSFNLDKAEFRDLVSADCHYCGAPPAQVVQARYGRNGGVVYNGVDRVDNTQGYEADNVVSCCGTCNRAKSVMSVADFTDWVRRVAATFKRREGT